MRDVPAWVWLFFVAFAIGELYFFLMQRSALEICRTSGLHDGARLSLLPGSYHFAWWAVAAKWLGAILLAWYGSILTAVSALAIAFVAGMIVPVPHSHFIPKFEARLKAFTTGETDPTLSVLRDALRRARQQLQT